MLKKLFPLLAVVAMVAVSAAPAHADPIKFARYPHFANGKIAFSYHGDIWVANADGSSPYRLTAHVAMDEFPRFSPDGQWVAFTSDRMGNDDVWIVPTAGGEPRQITFQTTGDRVQYWTPDGRGIVISSSRSKSPWGSPLYIVPLDGGIPMPMAMDKAAAGMISQDGSKVAFNRNGFTYWRKGYRGNNNTDIWVQNTGGGEITQLTDQDMREFRQHTQDAYPMWGADGMIYFMSERDGIFNIWKIAPTGGQPTQVTTHQADGVQYPSISPDGRTIVYENEFEIWRLDIPDGRPQRVTVDLAFDPKVNKVEYLQSDSAADGYWPSPDGDYIAVDYHGELFIVPSDPEFGEKKQVTSSPWREWRAVWSPDGSRLAYVSDETGEEEIWSYEIATVEKNRLTRHESLKSEMIFSPDGTKLAWEGSNRLFLTEVPGGRTTEIGYNVAGGYSLSAFSADGGWLVYSRSDEEQNSDVYLFDLNAGREYNMTANPFRDSGGELTPDGSTLIFLSNRDGTTHLYRVALERLTEDPDDPLVKERNRAAQRERSEREEEEAVPQISVNTDGIDKRAVQLTSGENGASSPFISTDGNTIYFVSSNDEGRGLFSIGLDGEGQRRITDGSFSGLNYTKDRRTVFYRQGGGVYRMPLSNREKTQIEFSFTVTVDKPGEWRQLFNEAWRTMKYRFYDPDMHGVDWDAMKRKYEPLLSYVGLNQDVYDLSNEMIGELNASHTGVSGPSGIESPDTYSTAHPGFELVADGNRYRVDHIYMDGPADREWIDLEVGEFVIALDGQEIRSPDNYWQILNQTLNDYVTVTVSASRNGRDAREIRVRTTGSLRNIQYQEWVAQRRKMVEEWSDGQIAYVHIRSMNQSSLEIFQNEINQYWQAKGIVVDIRYNGGGNTDQQLLDILERRPYEFWNSRWGAPTWGRRPRQAIAGPKVMLINWRSASDSEVTPKGFRDLGLGRIVGTPTYGAVIATGSYRLINGGSIRTPGSLVVTWDPTQPNNFGVNLENYGVPPDVWAENTPEDELQTFDRELKAAVDEALRMLREGTWQHGGG